MRGDQKKPEVNFQSCAQRNQTGAKLALSKCQRETAAVVLLA